MLSNKCRNIRYVFSNENKLYDMLMKFILHKLQSYGYYSRIL